MFVSLFIINSQISYILTIFFEVNQKIAISILKRLGYQDVIIASNGREALDLMRKHKFDIIFVSKYLKEKKKREEYHNKQYVIDGFIYARNGWTRSYSLYNVRT
jgi:hypothetical protein